MGNEQLKYSKVTISGPPGVGTSTLKNNLVSKLSAYSWKGFSGGEHMREYAVQQGYLNPDQHGQKHHSVAAYPPDFDRQVDWAMRQRLQKEDRIVLESWLAGFFALGVPEVLRVLLYCSDVNVAIQRVMERDGLSQEEAMQNVQGRVEENFTRWSQMYEAEWQEWVVEGGLVKPQEKIDFFNPDIYHLAIDTVKHNQEGTLLLVLGALGYQSA